MSSLKDTERAYCCVASWNEAQLASWKARDTSCACDPHIEYCDKCFPPAHRPGGAWDQCKPSPSAFADLIAERDELAQQRGDLAARVVALHELLADLRSGFEDVGKIAGLYVSAIDGAMAQASRTVTVAPDGQPSEQTK